MVDTDHHLVLWLAKQVSRIGVAEADLAFEVASREACLPAAGVAQPDGGVSVVALRPWVPHAGPALGGEPPGYIRGATAGGPPS